MALSGALERLQEEAICSICLEYMTEPVSVDCGHNFCHGCITKHCQEKCLWNDAPFSCPQCRAPCRRSSLRPNRQLANIVESIRQLRLGGGHDERLKLFCEVDEEAICVVCRESQHHRSHTVYPIEEAAQVYKTVKKKRERIVSEFGKLHRLLAAEEKLLLQKLEEEEKQILVMISESMFRLVEQKSLLDELILEIKEKMHLPDEGLLKVSQQQGLQLEHSSMLVADTQPAHEVRLSFLPSLTPVDVTLDPETAHPDLILSEDHKSVRRGGRKLLLSFFDNTRRFNSAPVVLGVQFFFSGRHYWEVHVGDKPEWGLGLCKEAASRKGNILFSPNNGYWVLRLQNGGNYEALTCPVSHLTLSIRPRCIGIFLDYEAGEISFYNVTDRSHLYTFTDKFSGKLRPLFYLGSFLGGKNAEPLSAVQFLWCIHPCW
uniref:Tripartite motif-containing protein 39 n=1 Tax=Anas platyrhynchos TaxID=8839 RepID=A0A8B9TN05_ANAPL